MRKMATANLTLTACAVVGVGVAAVGVGVGMSLMGQPPRRKPGLKDPPRLWLRLSPPPNPPSLQSPMSQSKNLGAVVPAR
jgi:hypothetical protein